MAVEQAPPLELVARGAPLAVVLEAICRLYEREAPRARCSIFTVANETLYFAAGPACRAPSSTGSPRVCRSRRAPAAAAPPRTATPRSSPPTSPATPTGRRGRACSSTTASAPAGRRRSSAPPGRCSAPSRCTTPPPRDGPAVVTSGEEALARIRAGARHDVILCDLMMPTMSGAQLHAEIAAVAPELLERMVFITGGAFTPAARAFLEQVPNLVVDKPFDAKLLAHALRERLR